jgi:hypothetical protein
MVNIFSQFSVSNKFLGFKIPLIQLSLNLHPQNSQAKLEKVEQDSISLMDMEDSLCKGIRLFNLQMEIEKLRRLSKIFLKTEKG